MTTSLVDPEGFPRADIDVYAIRHARVSLNRLRNDHRDVVDRLGRVLEEVYAVGAVVEPRLNGAGAGKMVDGDGPGSGSSSASVRPLARVNMVSESSPSATAVSVSSFECETETIRMKK
jgi:26S proteasome non-ATPase regulatory subunit 9